METKLYWSDGTVKYKGEVKDGKMHGQGTLYREDGILWYEGEFKDGERVQQHIPSKEVKNDEDGYQCFNYFNSSPKQLKN